MQLIYILTGRVETAILLPPGDKVPQPLVKHLSSVESAGKYDAEEGKHAACTLLPNVNGESNLAMTQSLLVV